jgi:hypothetical protein
VSVLAIIVVIGIVLGLWALAGPLLGTIGRIAGSMLKHPFTSLVALLALAAVIAYTMGVL